MEQNPSTTRTHGVDFYSIFEGIDKPAPYPAEFDITTEDYGDDGCDYEELNGMYDQVEMDELAYYEKLFKKEGGEG